MSATGLPEVTTAVHGGADPGDVSSPALANTADNCGYDGPGTALELPTTDLVVHHVTPPPTATTLRPRPDLGAAEAALVGRVLDDDDAREVTPEDVARAWLMTYADRPNTFRAYQRIVAEWLAFCAGARVDPLTAKRPLVELYKNWLYDQGKSPATVKQRLAAVSSFYTYAEDEELVRRSPARGVRRPKLSGQSTSTGLSREEARDFLAQARTWGPQVHALMTLLLMNGLRASEALDCRLNDFGTQNAHRYLAVRRKGLDGRVRVPIAPVTWRALSTWIEQRPALLERSADPEATTDLLFFRIHARTRTPEAWDRRKIFDMVRGIGAKAVPDKPRLHPHDLRHAFVTLSLDAGVPMRDVQDSAGHASPVTTQRYDRNRNQMDRHATYALATHLGTVDA